MCRSALPNPLRFVPESTPRYDKLDPHHPAFVQLASIVLWPRTLGDMA